MGGVVLRPGGNAYWTHIRGRKRTVWPDVNGITAYRTCIQCNICDNLKSVKRYGYTGRPHNPASIRTCKDGKQALGVDFVV